MDITIFTFFFTVFVSTHHLFNEYIHVKFNSICLFLTNTKSLEQLDLYIIISQLLWKVTIGRENFQKVIKGFLKMTKKYFQNIFQQDIVPPLDHSFEHRPRNNSECKTAIPQTATYRGLIFYTPEGAVVLRIDCICRVYKFFQCSASCK